MLRLNGRDSPLIRGECAGLALAQCLLDTKSKTSNRDESRTKPIVNVSDDIKSQDSLKCWARTLTN